MKELTVSQRAERVGRATAKRYSTGFFSNLSKSMNMLIFAVARRAWRQGYLTAIKEVRAKFNRGDPVLHQFLQDRNRLK